ncbi:MAG TPA: hypothetical protein VMB72_01325 [Acidimicrobiales bacterium]|nr:hypothetical protein [Acidimicrobiales bacterium]
MTGRLGVSSSPAGPEAEVVAPLRRALDDATVKLAVTLVEAMGVVERIEAWVAQEHRGPGGRPETFSKRTLLVALVLCALTDQPLELTQVTDVLFRQLNARWRAELAVPDPPSDPHGWRAAYRSVRHRFHALVEVMDPSWFPKNRRLDPGAFEAQAARRQAQHSEGDWAVRYERLDGVVNQIIEASWSLLPRDVRRSWKGSLGIDATFVASFARRPKRRREGYKKRTPRPILIHSVDPDAGVYEREADERDGEDGTAPKSGYGYEATLGVAGPDDDESGFPSLVAGMAVLHRPGAEPGKNGTRVLATIARRGHRAGWLAGDRAYSSAKAEDLQLPARSLGYHPVWDYKDNQLGVKDSCQGLNQVEGGWYCPMMPTALVDASADVRAGRIDAERYATRIAERQTYAARPKARPSAEGDVRLLCPAAGANPVVRCPLKPRSLTRAPAGSQRIVLDDEIAEHPPACCTQETVTVHPEAGAKFAQDLPYQSPAWHATYHRLRNATEGMNGFLKDPAHEALGDAGRRRVHGVAAQSFFTALLILAANVRKIRTFLEQRAIAAGKVRRLPSRRRTRRLSEWLPAAPTTPDAPEGPDPPSSA